MAQIEGGLLAANIHPTGGGNTPPFIGRVRDGGMMH